MNLMRKIRQLSSDRRSRRSANSATSRGGSEDVCTSGGGGPGSCASWVDAPCVASGSAISPTGDVPPESIRNAADEPLANGGSISARDSRRSFELSPLRAAVAGSGGTTPPPSGLRIGLSSSYDSSHRPPLPVPPASSGAHHNAADGTAQGSRFGRRNAHSKGEELSRGGNAGEPGEAGLESGLPLKGKGRFGAEGLPPARGKAAAPQSEGLEDGGGSGVEDELSSCEEIASNEGGLTPPPHLTGQQEHSRAPHLYTGSNCSVGGGSGTGNAAVGAAGAHGSAQAAQVNPRGGGGTNSLAAWRWHQNNKVADWLLGLPDDIGEPPDSNFASLQASPDLPDGDPAAVAAPTDDAASGADGGDCADEVLGAEAQGLAGVAGGARSEVYITSAAVGAAAAACAERQAGLALVKVASGRSGGVQSCTAPESGTPSPSQPSPRAVVGGGSGGADDAKEGQEGSGQAERAVQLTEEGAGEGGMQGAAGEEQPPPPQNPPLPKRQPRRPDDVAGMIAELAPVLGGEEGGSGESAAEAVERQVEAARALRQMARGGEDARESIVAAGAIPAFVLILQQAAEAAAAAAETAGGAASNGGRKENSSGASSLAALLASPLVDYSISALVNLSVCRDIKVIIHDAGALQPLIVLLRGSAVPSTISPLIGDSNPRADAHSHSYTHGHTHSQPHTAHHSHSHSHTHTHLGHSHSHSHNHIHQSTTPTQSVPVALPPSATSASTRANAAVALYSLSKLDDATRVNIGDLGGVDALVGFLADRSVSKGKRDAVTALHSLSTVAPNRPRLVHAGAVHMLLEWVAACKKPAGTAAAGAGIAAGGSIGGSQRGGNEEEELVLVERALAVLAQVAASEEGRVEVVGRGGIETLLVLLQSGGGPSVACAEYAVAALLALANSSSTLRRKLHSLNLGPALTSLAVTFSPKAKTKVNKLLDILHVH